MYGDWMSKLKIMIVLLALVLIVGQSCKRDGGSGGPKLDDSTGTEGLVMSFIEGLPPEEIWKGVDFGIWLDIHNKGISDAEVGSVCMSTINTNIFTKAINCLPLKKIEGRGVRPNFDGNLGGELQRYGEENWDGIAVKGSHPLNVDTTLPLAAKVCYQYSTTLSPQACIRDLVMNEADVLCEAGELDVLRSQGAPVAVTFLKEDIVPRGSQNELIFTMTVENVGGGDVIKSEAIKSGSACNFERKDENLVNVEVELPGFGKANCRNKGNVAMINGRGQAFCSGIKVPKGDSFPLPLNIKLTYGYISRERSEILVKKDVLEGN
jgi:hypothetical protein